MTDKKLIIFDFDGVLVNIGYVLHEEANPTLPREYFTRFSDGNFLDNMNRAIREEGYVVQKNWEDLYNRELLKLSSHDAIDRLVRSLAEKYELVIVSSSLSRHINDFIAKESLEGCFAEVLGSDAHTSKVVKITDLLKRRTLSPDETLFITDTLGDVRDGATCGVASVGVTWGTHDRETLEKGDPCAIVDTVPELEDAIRKFFVIQ